MQKSDLLNWLREQHREWQALLDQVDPARMDQPGVTPDWSMKDIVAHLTGWNRGLIVRMQATQRGDPEPPTLWPAHLKSDDEINAWLYEANRGRSAREVLDESQQMFQQLFAFIESLPDDVEIETYTESPGRDFYLVWLDGKRFPAGEFFYHFHDDHEPDIRAWLMQGEKR